MGCWNKTCGLSNLHIRAGEDVIVFAVVESKPGSRSRCHTNSFYDPILLPFYAKYDDYGKGENAHGIGLPLIMEGIKAILVEKEQGENEFHDIPVYKNDFDVNLFFDAAQESRLETKFGISENMKIDFTMLRADIVEEVFREYKILLYIQNSVVACGFDDIVGHVSPYLAKLKQTIKKIRFTEKQKPVDERSDEYYLTFRGFHLVDTEEKDNYVERILSNDEHRTTKKFVRLYDIVVELLLADEDQIAEQVLIEYLKAIFLDTYMNSVRKVWLPGTFEGSQSQDTSSYKILSSAMNNAILREEMD